MTGIKITPLAAPGRYRGRKARRQAFAASQRAVRALQRIANAITIPADILAAYSDALIYGTGVVKIERLEPRAELDPFTGQPWALPYRVRTVSREEFERDYPAGLPGA